MKRTATILLLLLLSGVVRAQERIDPRHPNAIEFPEFGRMIGTIGTTTGQAGIGERYGFRICPVGDVNHDGLADWMVGHERIDSIQNFEGIRLPPVEFLLYKGVRGKLPTVQSGVRIGPTELFGYTDFLGSGDFDADGNRDIVMLAGAYGDTSFGNNGRKELRYVSVYWGNDSGVYSNNDTSRLLCSAYTWLDVACGATGDITGDSVDDLVLYSELGEAQGWGRTVRIPRMSMFSAGRNQRWGRNGISAHARMTWWSSNNDLTTPELDIIDHDGDGANDIALLELSSNAGGTNSRISILYGRAGRELPDTLDMEQLTLSIANGKATRLRDITGDGIREMTMTTGSEAKFKVFAGRRNQRLLAQYGAGYGGPTAGQGWWSRPWQVILQPVAINDGWTYVLQVPLPDLGDGNLDRVDDIWSYSEPFLLCYTTGKYLDQWIDGYFRIGGLYAAANVGDIDGSGKQSIALFYDQIPRQPVHPFPGGVVFIKQNPSLPTNYLDPPLRLPHEESIVRDNHTSGVDITIIREGGSQRQSLRLLNGMPGTHYPVQVINMLGEAVVSYDLVDTQTQVDLDLPRGLYFVSMTTPAGVVTRALPVD
jgi:hypothetical protein